MFLRSIESDCTDESIRSLLKDKILEYLSSRYEFCHISHELHLFLIGWKNWSNTKIFIRFAKLLLELSDIH